MNAVKTTEKPITLNMKVGDLLKEYPALLDVLVVQSPHFNRLKNPILRRVHGKLVTLAQAAQIAGLDPAALVRTLNAAAGLSAVDETPLTLPTSATGEEPAWLNTTNIAVPLDVREDQRNHQDPFARIMAAIPQVQEGQIFYLRNTFEPLPLYDVLGKRGFVAWSRQIGDQDWEIYFFNAGRGEKGQDSAPVEPAISAPDADDVNLAAAPVATISIDVRELTPPQPMLKILDGLAQIRSGETLLVHHQRRPAYLYPKLAELGYTHKTVELGPNQVDIYIHKP